MNHQYFKDWLLTEEPLTFEQTQKLEQHINECNSCQQLQTAWLDIHRLIKVIPDVDPVPGFTTRWEERVIQQRKQAQKRLTWIAFTSLSGIALLVTVMLGFQVFELIRSPQQITLVFLSRIAVLISYLTITKDYLNFLSTYIPEVSFPIIVFSSGLMTLLCVLWFATMKQVSSDWRIVK
jgi:hypothetical protein